MRSEFPGLPQHDRPRPSLGQVNATSLKSKSTIMEKFSAFGVSEDPCHTKTLIYLREGSRIREQA